MKKIRSLLLAGLMTASVFAVGASAEHLVGYNKTDSKYDGVETWPTTNPSSNGDIHVKVEKVVHKYAVDLTYTFDDFTVGGATWNTDTMRYDIDANKLPTNGTRTIQVDNRSDLPVYAVAALSNTDSQNGITISVDHNTNENRLVVPAAAAGVGNANGTAGTGNVTVTVSAQDWRAVANYYIRQVGTDDLTTGKSFTIATITVTISAS